MHVGPSRSRCTRYCSVTAAFVHVRWASSPVGCTHQCPVQGSACQRFSLDFSQDRARADNSSYAPTDGLSVTAAVGTSSRDSLASTLTTLRSSCDSRSCIRPSLNRADRSAPHEHAAPSVVNSLVGTMQTMTALRRNSDSEQLSRPLFDQGQHCRSHRQIAHRSC